MFRKASPSLRRMLKLQRPIHYPSSDLRAKETPLESVKMSYISYEPTVHRGSAAPLLIMHGLFGSKMNWNSLCKLYVERLDPPRKVISVDARNHGESPHSAAHSYAHLAEDVRTFLADHGIAKAVLMGHSMGGRTVMLFALKYPELVDKLIVADISPIINPTNETDSTYDILEVLKAVRMPKNTDLMEGKKNVENQLGKYIRDIALRKFLLTNLVRKGEDRFDWRINIYALSENFRKHIASFPSVEGLTFFGPTLFIGGGESNYINRDDHLQILQLFPKATFRYIPGAGHLVHSEKPTEYSNITVEFINKTTANNNLSSS